MNDTDTTTDTDTRVTAMTSTDLHADTLPKRVLIAPWGQVESTNGSFVVDDEAVRSAVDAFTRHGTDLPIDYEHQTLGGTFASPSGAAPAAGWIKNLAGEPGVGLIADIEWTDPARDMLSAKQYRYLSPVAVVRKTDRKLVAIHSAALTNKPAIVGMTPIVNHTRDHLTDPTGDAPHEPLVRLRAELDLPADTDAEHVLIVAGRTLAELRRRAADERIQHRVRDAVRAGRLVEAQRAWAQRLAMRDEQLFDEWVHTAPVVIHPGAVTTPPDAAAAPAGHNAAAARAEYRNNPLLAKLTTEDAYVADALRTTAAHQ